MTHKVQRKRCKCYKRESQEQLVRVVYEASPTHNKDKQQSAAQHNHFFKYLKLVLHLLSPDSAPGEEGWTFPEAHDGQASGFRGAVGHLSRHVHRDQRDRTTDGKSLSDLRPRHIHHQYQTD